MDQNIIIGIRQSNDTHSGISILNIRPSETTHGMSHKFWSQFCTWTLLKIYILATDATISWPNFFPPHIECWLHQLHYRNVSIYDTPMQCARSSFLSCYWEMVVTLKKRPEYIFNSWPAATINVDPTGKKCRYRVHCPCPLGLGVMAGMSGQNFSCR